MIRIERQIYEPDKKDKFIKNLSLYRSLPFRFIDFDIKTDDEELNDIVTALNIKNTRKRITFVYDKTCEIVEKFYKGKNICGFKNGQCRVQRNNCNDKINGCCRICKYQSDKGCTTANVACKFFNCDEVRKDNEVLEFDDVAILKVLNKRQRTLLKSDYFSKRENVIDDVSLGLFLGTAKMYMRLIKNIFTK